MKLYKNKEWLKEQYVDKRRHINNIGEQCGAAGRTVATWTKRFGLTRRRYGSYNIDDSFLSVSIRKRRLIGWGLLLLMDV